MQRKCRLEWCQRQRTPLSLYCREHLTDSWMNRLPETTEPAWRRWTREHNAAKEVA